MGIPRKTANVAPSFKQFFINEGGWKAVVKVFGGIGLVCFGGYQFYKFQKQQRMGRSYTEGLALYEAGVKASDMGPEFYNEKRPQPEFAKCQVDTSQKVRYAQTILDLKSSHSES